MRISDQSIDIIPIYNAPHRSIIKIEKSEIKYSLPYRYMYQNKAVRLVKFDGEEYIVVTKD